MIEIDSGYLGGRGTVCPKTPLHIREMTEIEKTEGEIKVLQAKLELLKEMENHKSPVEEAYKRVYGWYPPTAPSVSNCEDNRWSAFRSGYYASQKDCKVVENNKNFEPTPQTPEQVEQGLRDAMKQAKEDGVFDEPKPKTLLKTFYDAIHKSDRHMLVDDLCEVVEEWLPDEFDPNEAYEIGWNDALRTIKQKLR